MHSSPRRTHRIYTALACAGTLGVILFCLIFVNARKAPPLAKADVATERGAWLWTDPSRITPTYRDNIIRAAKENRITAIYLKMDLYLYISAMKASSNKDKQLRTFEERLVDFLHAAQKSGIAVDAVVGAPNWSEIEYSEKADVLLTYVQEFNKTHNEQFRGFQYDVEPYVLPRYNNDKAGVLAAYVALVDKTIEKLAGSDLRFSIAIPDFYDARAASSPRFAYGGTTGYTFDHLLSILEKRPGSTIIVMAYRDRAEGMGGVIDIASGELREARGTSTGVMVALETGDVLDSGISFYGLPKQRYLDAVENIEAAFSGESNYAGLATDHLEALESL